MLPKSVSPPLIPLLYLTLLFKSLLDRYPFGYHTNTFNFTYSKRKSSSLPALPPKLAPFAAFFLSQDFHLPLNCPRPSSSATLPTSFPHVLWTARPRHSNSQETLQTITCLLPDGCLPRLGHHALSRSTENSPWQVLMFLILSDLFLHHSLGSFLKSLASLPWLPIHSPSGTGAIPTLVELSLNAKRPETVSEVSCD